MAGQIPLEFPLAEDYTFDRFRAGRNGELLRALEGDMRSLWLYGEPAVGKTHLLQATCREAAQAAFLPASEIPFPEVDLAGYETYATVLIDDLHLWLGHRGAEAEIVGLVEGQRETGARMVVSAGALPPTAIEFAFPDLASRMRAFETFEVKPLPADQLGPFFVDAAGVRGLEIADEVVEYLLARVGRSQGALLEVLATLDRESLARSRRITVRFAREILGL